jgi:hypothetical protein
MAFVIGIVMVVACVFWWYAKREDERAARNRVASGYERRDDWPPCIDAMRPGLQQVAYEKVGPGVSAAEKTSEAIGYRPRVPLTYEDHLEVAFWEVVASLQPADIPMAKLDQLKPRLLASLSSGSEVAGKLLCSALSDIEWDWPMWHAWAKRDSCDSIPKIDTRILRLTPCALLDRQSKAELIKLCEIHGVVFRKSAAKKVLIGLLREALSPEDYSALAEPLRGELRQGEHAVCRKEMALRLCSRIASIAHNANRYEQLTDPDFLSIGSHWQFVWVDDLVTPRACKKFDQMVLPARKAYRVFPHLPCKHLRCSCRITSVSDNQRLAQLGGLLSSSERIENEQ